MTFQKTVLVLALAAVWPLMANAQAPSDSSSKNKAKEQTLTVAVVSPRCVFGDVEANLAHFTKLAEQAASKGARLVCFPELALVSYSTHKSVLKSAEPIPGPSTKKLDVMAIKAGHMNQ